jgi:hypothetical protein
MSRQRCVSRIELVVRGLDEPTTPAVLGDSHTAAISGAADRARLARKGSLSSGQIARSAGEERQNGLEALEQGSRQQGARACGRELDGQSRAAARAKPRTDCRRVRSRRSFSGGDRAASSRGLSLALKLLSNWSTLARIPSQTACGRGLESEVLSDDDPHTAGSNPLHTERRIARRTVDDGSCGLGVQVGACRRRCRGRATTPHEPGAAQGS